MNFHCVTLQIENSALEKASRILDRVEVLEQEAALPLRVKCTDHPLTLDCAS